MSSTPEQATENPPDFLERHPKITLTVAGGILVICYLEWLALTSMAGAIAPAGFPILQGLLAFDL